MRLDFGIRQSIQRALPNPDALFDTRTGLVVSDSIGGLTANLKDFIYFNHKGGATLLNGCNTAYQPPDSGDFTYVVFVKPNQTTTNANTVRGLAGNSTNYISISNTAKTVTGFINNSSITPATAFPDNTNYTSNIYMIVYRYKSSTTTVTVRIYNTSINYNQTTKVASIPSNNGGVVRFNQTNINATIGYLASYYFISYLSDSDLTALWNGTIPSNLTSYVPFVCKESVRTFHYDPVYNGSFEFTNGQSESSVKPYYNLRTNNIHSTAPLIYGYSLRDLQQVSYTPSSLKGITSKVGDIEMLSSGCIWNMADCRLYFNAITDATIKAIFDKSNRTYWKSTIESEDHYIDAGSGYYCVWGAEQLQRDFITTHAQSGHENHIFSSLRTNGGVVTGITAIRVYKTNVS